MGLALRMLLGQLRRFALGFFTRHRETVPRQRC